MHIHTHKFYTIKKKPAIIEFRRVGTTVTLGEKGTGRLCGTPQFRTDILY